MTQPGQSVLEMFQRALRHHQAGRVAEAEAGYREVLAANPRHADSLNLLGVLAQQAGRYDLAVEHINQAIALQPESAAYRNNLGRALAALGRVDEAEAAMRAALRLKPDLAEAHNSLGNLLIDTGRRGEAEAHFRAAVQARPESPELHSNLGVLLTDLGRFPEAKDCLETALRLRPDYAEAHYNLGNVLKALGRLPAAEAAFRAALRLRPDLPEAHNNLGIVLQALGRADDAEACFRAALRLRPGYADAHNNLGIVLKDLGRFSEAEGCFRAALRLNPNFVSAHSGLIYILDFMPGVAPAAQQAERRKWYEQHARKFAGAIPAHANTRDPDRRLRIGYVSADFRNHSAAYSFGPILRRHDHAKFEVFCYSNVAPSDADEKTAEFQAAADCWRPVADLGDAALAAQILSDRIDVLVDLSGHTRGHRLLTFARKPAPVQISAWGHSTGTGLATMDYLFSDPVAVPPADRPLFAETVIDLPCLVVYEAPAYAPPVPPAAAAGTVTFGCFNRLAKVSETALDVWARLLAAVPGSLLLLKDRRLDDRAVETALRARFAARGVAAERLLTLGSSGHAEHLAAYSRIDIALDPIPHGGGISSLEALWMGVPVVTLMGTTMPGRITPSILTALDLRDWIAADEAGYIAIAAARAADRAGLERLRGSLRPRLAASPVGNAELYTRAVEAAYRDAWRRWCAAGT